MRDKTIQFEENLKLQEQNERLCQEILILSKKFENIDTAVIKYTNQLKNEKNEIEDDKHSLMQENTNLRNMNKAISEQNKEFREN